jgi:hypothetical protein
VPAALRMWYKEQRHLTPVHACCRGHHPSRVSDYYQTQRAETESLKGPTSKNTLPLVTSSGEKPNHNECIENSIRKVKHLRWNTWVQDTWELMPMHLWDHPANWLSSFASRKYACCPCLRLPYLYHHTNMSHRPAKLLVSVNLVKCFAFETARAFACLNVCVCLCVCLRLHILNTMMCSRVRDANKTRHKVAFLSGTKQHAGH